MPPEHPFRIVAGFYRKEGVPIKCKILLSSVLFACLLLTGCTGSLSKNDLESSPPGSYRLQDQSLYVELVRPYPEYEVGIVDTYTASVEGKKTLIVEYYMVDTHEGGPRLPEVKKPREFEIDISEKTFEEVYFKRQEELPSVF